MKSTILIKITLFSLFLISFTGCSDFLDVNDDPNAATEAPGDLLFVEATVTLQSNRNIELGPNTAFFTQIWASNNSAGSTFTGPERFNIGSASFSVTNAWGALWPNVLNNLQLFINDAESQDPVRSNGITQAKLLQAYTFYVITALWGDVPFSEALREDIQNPVFDPQEDVLRGIVTRIDEALSLIDPNDATPAINNGDLFYDGNMQQWRQFGNSLKLRVMMLIYNRDTSVASEIQALIDNPDLIRLNADNFEFPYNSSNGNENQIFQLHADFASGQPAFLYGTDVLINLMNSKNDPRLATYFMTNTEDNYVGVKSGASGFDGSLVGANIIRPSFPGRILTASETLLHEAEFLAAEGQEAAARAKLQAGIEASIDYFDGIPGTIADADRDVYVSAILADFDAGSVEEKLRIIQEEHFIDVFEKSPENWTLWRRTKMPELALPQSANLGTIIRRMPYPSTEASSNPNTPSPVPTNDQPMWFENQ